MGLLLRWLCALTLVALVLAGCGGGGGRGRSGRRSHGSGAAAATTPGSPAAAKAPKGFAGRLLTDGELPGFVITGSSVYTSPEGFVSSEQLQSGQASAELRMLRTNGFRVAAQEDLSHSGEEGLSLVERFASPAAARNALGFYASRFRASGQAAHYTPFRVPRVPGAVGFVLGDPGGAGTNVAFSVGDYYYLIGQVGSGPGPERQLARAARSLYGRVRP